MSCQDLVIVGLLSSAVCYLAGFVRGRYLSKRKDQAA